MWLPRSIIGSCAVALSMLPALAEERVLAVDGAGLALRPIEPNGLEIYYNPSGVVLVRGQWVEDVLEGEAFRILDDCAPISYPIRGIVSRSGRLVVIGTAAETCAQQPTGVLAVMRFEPPAKMAKAKRKAKPEKSEAPRIREAMREEPKRKRRYEARAQAREPRRVRYVQQQPVYQQQQFGFFGQGWRW
jgi:hypothetical protein